MQKQKRYVCNSVNSVSADIRQSLGGLKPNLYETGESVSIDLKSDNGILVQQYDDLQILRNHPLIQEFASVNDDLYELIKATNPTLRMFVDFAKKIVFGGGQNV